MIPSSLDKSISSFASKRKVKVSKYAISEAWEFLSNHTSLPEAEKEEVIMKSLSAVSAKSKDSYEGDSKLPSKEIGRQIVLVCTENGIKIRRVPKDLQKELESNYTGGSRFDHDQMLGAYYVLDLQPDLTKREKRDIFLDAVDDTFEKDEFSSFEGNFNYSLFASNIAQNVKEVRKQKRADLAAGHLISIATSEPDNFEGKSNPKIEKYSKSLGLTEDHIEDYFNFQMDSLIPRKDLRDRRRQNFVKAQKRMAMMKPRTESQYKKAEVGAALATGGISLIGSGKRKRRREEKAAREEEQRRQQMITDAINARLVKKALKKRKEKKAAAAAIAAAKADVVGVNTGLSEATQEIAPVDNAALNEAAKDMAQGAVPTPSGGGGGGAGGGQEEEPDMGEYPEEYQEEEYTEEQYPVDEIHEEEYNQDDQEDQEDTSENQESDQAMENPEPEDTDTRYGGVEQEMEMTEESFLGLENSDNMNSLITIVVVIAIAGIAYWLYKKYSK